MRWGTTSRLGKLEGVQSVAEPSAPLPGEAFPGRLPNHLLTPGQRRGYSDRLRRSERAKKKNADRSSSLRPPPIRVKPEVLLSPLGVIASGTASHASSSRHRCSKRLRGLGPFKISPCESPAKHAPVLGHQQRILLKNQGQPSRASLLCRKRPRLEHAAPLLQVPR